MAAVPASKSLRKRLVRIVLAGSAPGSCHVQAEGVDQNRLERTPLQQRHHGRPGRQPVPCQVLPSDDWFEPLRFCCVSDWPRGLYTQATIAAFNNMYATSPTTYWAYNTGGGTAHFIARHLRGRNTSCLRSNHRRIRLFGNSENVQCGRPDLRYRGSPTQFTSQWIRLQQR